LKKSYIRINLILAGIIAGIMLYSGIFSPEKADPPIPCFVTVITGHTCPGCGLSRSFSAMIRGEFKEAMIYNINGPKIFLFFFSQFFLRILISLSISKISRLHSWIWITDVAISILLFGWAFWGLMLWKF